MHSQPSVPFQIGETILQDSLFGNEKFGRTCKRCVVKFLAFTARISLHLSVWQPWKLKKINSSIFLIHSYEKWKHVYPNIAYWDRALWILQFSCMMTSFRFPGPSKCALQLRPTLFVNKIMHRLNLCSKLYRRVYAHFASLSVLSCPYCLCREFYILEPWGKIETSCWLCSWDSINGIVYVQKRLFMCSDTAAIDDIVRKCYCDFWDIVPLRARVFLQMVSSIETPLYES